MIFIHFNYILDIYLFFIIILKYINPKNTKGFSRKLVGCEASQHLCIDMRRIQPDRGIHVALELSRHIWLFHCVCVCIFPSAQEAKSRLVRPVAVCPAIVQPVIDVEVRIKSDTGFRNTWLFSSMNCKPTG